MKITHNSFFCKVDLHDSTDSTWYICEATSTKLPQMASRRIFFRASGVHSEGLFQWLTPSIGSPGSQLCKIEPSRVLETWDNMYRTTGTMRIMICRAEPSSTATNWFGHNMPTALNSCFEHIFLGNEQHGWSLGPKPNWPSAQNASAWYLVAVAPLLFFS